MEAGGRPPLVEGERNLKEIGAVETEVSKIGFPASKRTLVDALGGMVVHYGGETLRLDDVISELEIEEFSTRNEFLRDLGEALARRFRD